MKKRILLVIGLILLITFPITICVIFRVSDSDMADGTYHVVDCETYPNAYIIVKGQTVQFYNIDLNATYGDSQFEEVYWMQTRKEAPIDTGYTIEELKQMADLNVAFCENSYNYSKVNVHKQGTFTYWYPCRTDAQFFGLQLIYNSWDRTIKINNYQMNILFKK